MLLSNRGQPALVPTLDWLTMAPEMQGRRFAASFSDDLAREALALAATGAF